MKECISALKTHQSKKERKGKSKPKTETKKEKNLSMHALIQHRYFTLFEEKTDTLLEEYIGLIGEDSMHSTIA
jgi:hypothetical protein